MGRLRRFFLMGSLLSMSACGQTDELSLANDFPPTVGISEDPLYYLSTKLWPTQQIRVCWEAMPADEADERGWVRDAIERSWEDATELDFVGWEACGTDEDIRIAVWDIATNGPSAVGLGTNVDNVTNGIDLNFTFANWGAGSICSASEAGRQQCIRSIAVHEFGHALGFAHEQNRDDTDRTTCTQPVQGSNGDTTFREWDLSSVMNYCNPIYNNNGNLSAIDANGARMLYGERHGNRFFAADVNADGRTDVLRRQFSGRIEYWRNTGSGNYTLDSALDTGYSDEQGWKTEGRFFVMDYDGDLDDDLVTRNASGVFGVIKSSGTGLTDGGVIGSTDLTDAWGFSAPNRFFVANWDGDTDDDLIVRYASGEFGAWSWTGTSLAYAGSILNTNWFSDANGFLYGNRVFVANLDNDNDDDFIVRYATGELGGLRSNGTSLAYIPLATTGLSDSTGWNTPNRFFVADWNGDGNDDLLARNSSGDFLGYQSNGTTLSYAGTIATTSFSDAQNWGTGERFLIIRAGNDTKDDLLAHPSDGLNLVWTSNGTSLSYSHTVSSTIY